MGAWPCPRFEQLPLFVSRRGLSNTAHIHVPIICHGMAISKPSYLRSISIQTNALFASRSSNTNQRSQAEPNLHDDDHVSYYSMRSAAQAIEFLHRRKVGRERLLCQQPTTRAAVYYHQALAHNTIHNKSPLPQKIKLINKEAPYIHPRLQATRIPYTRCHPAAETVYTLHPM